MRISDWSSDVCSSDLVARLVDAAQARGLPAPDQAGVSSQAARQQLRDHRGLAVRAGREHHRFVLPPHGRPTQAGSLGIELQAKIAIALGIIEPVLAHFHEDEQMDRLAECLFHVLLRRLAPEPYGLAALAQADRLVLIAAAVADLLDARRAVLEIFPALGLDGPPVGQESEARRV